MLLTFVDFFFSSFSRPFFAFNHGILPFSLSRSLFFSLFFPFHFFSSINHSDSHFSFSSLFIFILRHHSLTHTHPSSPSSVFPLFFSRHLLPFSLSLLQSSLLTLSHPHTLTSCPSSSHKQQYNQQQTTTITTTPHSIIDDTLPPHTPQSLSLSHYPTSHTRTRIHTRTHYLSITPPSQQQTTNKHINHKQIFTTSLSTTPPPSFSSSSYFPFLVVLQPLNLPAYLFYTPNNTYSLPYP